MPLVQKTIALTAGATSDNVLANTNYEFIDGNVRIRVAAAASAAGTTEAIDNKLNVSVNNAEYSRNASIPALVTGQPFSVLAGDYNMNDLITTGAQRNRVLVQITNDTAATVTYRIGVFIGG